MNSFERFSRRLAGQPVDRAPNFNLIMGFGMRYLGLPLDGYYRDHRILAQAQLVVCQDFDLDCVSIISDSYREAADLGAHIEFPADGMPVCRVPLLRDTEDLRSFRLPEPLVGARMGDSVEGVRLLRERTAGSVPVMGWVEGALAQANILVGDGTLLLALYDRPAWVEDLLELCTQVEIAFALAQIQAGAHLIGLGDAIASLLSTKMYLKYALPYEQRIFQAVHAAGAAARLHICGNTTRLLPYMAQSGADVIDLDWMVDLRAGAGCFAGQASACGNFDPVAVMLRGTPEQVYAATLECHASGGERWFSAAGCEIPEGTPHANLHAQTQALKDVGG